MKPTSSAALVHTQMCPCMFSPNVICLFFPFFFTWLNDIRGILFISWNICPPQIESKWTLSAHTRVLYCRIQMHRRCQRGSLDNNEQFLDIIWHASIFMPYTMWTVCIMWLCARTHAYTFTPDMWIFVDCLRQSVFANCIFSCFSKSG